MEPVRAQSNNLSACVSKKLFSSRCFEIAAGTTSCCDAGGIGTFEELFETWTWRQLGYHNKPIGVLNQDGYYDHLLTFMHHSVDEGFMDGHQWDLIATSAEAEALLKQLVTSAGFPQLANLDGI